MGSSANAFSAGIDKAFSSQPNVELNADTMMDANKYKQSFKEDDEVDENLIATDINEDGEATEATGSGSVGGYSAPVFGGDDEFWKKSRGEMKETDITEGDNQPTNSKLWSRAKSLAKSKFKVYPSAYANGWAAKWYKSKGGGWKKKVKSESTETNEILDEDLRKWFKEKWVDVSKKVNGKHPPCGRKDAEGKAYPKCRPSNKVSKDTPRLASSYDKNEKKEMTQQKRRAEKEDPKVGKGNKPTMTHYTESVDKVEAKEATTSGSVGQYSSPSMWAKSTNKKDWGTKRKTQVPGGSFVSVKKKCKKFPYCNQGDIKALNIYKNESVKEAIKSVSDKLNLSETVIKAILEYEYEKISKRTK